MRSESHTLNKEESCSSKEMDFESQIPSILLYWFDHPCPYQHQQMSAGSAEDAMGIKLPRKYSRKLKWSLTLSMIASRRSSGKLISDSFRMAITICLTWKHSLNKLAKRSTNALEHQLSVVFRIQLPTTKNFETVTHFIPLNTPFLSKIV